MPKMTREEAIKELSTIQDLFFWMKDRVAACSLAIEALRGDPAAAQRNQLLKEVEELRKELADKVKYYETKLAETYELTRSECDTAWELYVSAEEANDAAEEALKAMEREIANGLDFRSWITNNIRREQIIETLGAELAAEREKVEKLKVWLRNNAADLYGLHEAWRTYKAFDDKVLELWPDPAPEPELHDWAWAQEAQRIAIEALRGEPTAAQRDQLLKEVEDLRHDLNIKCDECPTKKTCDDCGMGYFLETGELRVQLNATEEALKAMERERGHDPWWGQQQCDACDDRVKAADAEIAWKCNDETQSENIRLRAELQSEREKGVETKRLIQEQLDNDENGPSLIGLGFALSLVDKVWPDPAPKTKSYGRG